MSVFKFKAAGLVKRMGPEELVYFYSNLNHYCFKSQKGLTKINSSSYFNKLKRDYPRVRGYEAFDTVSYNAAYSLYHLEKYLSAYPRTLVNLDPSSGQLFELELGFLKNKENYSVWFLDNNIFEAFDKTKRFDEQSGVDLELVVPRGVIMLPQKLYNIEGDFCQYITFYHSTVIDKTNLYNFSGKVVTTPSTPYRYIRWSTYLSNGHRLSSAYNLDEGNKVKYTFDVNNNAIVKCRHDEEIGGPDVKDSPNKELFRDIESIVIQTLLYLQTRPEDVTPVNPYSLAPVEPKQSKKGGKKRYTPLMIGKQFKPRTETVPLGGTHASPRTHWRRGHWRRVAIGEGRGERKWHWFQPVLVNG